MTIKPKLTTKAACRVAKLHPDRFNEHVASGAFPCAPATVPGRARLFDPDDMIALWYFQQFLSEGHDAKSAGKMACEIATVARQNPDEPVIALVQDYFYTFTAYPPSVVPDFDKWDTPEAMLNGSDIESARYFRISKTRAMIAHYTEEERSIIGEDD